MKPLLLSSACAIAVFFTASAAAQQPGNEPLEPADVADPGEAGGLDAGADAGVIVITAQGREQQLADVPIAVSAVNAEALQNSGANDIRELNQLAPSLLVSSTGNEANGSARVRGIGTVGDNPGLESSVAVFIDGVYRSRTGASLNELGPIERVEVLRGPQGTLFGRNASAGLLNIVTEGPQFGTEFYGAASYGNYDFFRLEGGANAAFNDRIAGRVDGVYVRRDGFYNDVINNTDVNDRDRYLVRGQLLFEPNQDLSLRLIGDYAKKDEKCCAAVFLTPDVAPAARVVTVGDQFNPIEFGPALTSTANTIIPVLLALGQDPRALSNPYSRDIYPTPGRSYAGETEDWGVSLQADWDFGAAELTSITAYRDYFNSQGSDTDYTTVDILFRDPGNDAGSRQFQTFSQELRLQGTAFGDRLDWLIGGYYAQEDLKVRENLKFGTQYGAFVACRAVILVNPALLSPSSTGCLGAGGRAALLAANGGAGAFGPATPLIFAGLDQLASVGNVGDDGSIYRQDSENYAFFTHNIIHLTDRLDLTVGLRYTNETKDFSADFNNTNTICPAQRALLSPLLPTPLAPLAGGLITLACQGNSTSELNALALRDTRDEDEFTGTAVLSYKPNDDTLLYASYSRGYKAGGFNLDRSALNNPVFNPAVAGSTANLQFDQEEVDAYELGVKYATPAFSISAAAFRQEFTNFQLNTFNGTVFLVQNVNACSADLGGADGDTDPASGACDPKNVEPGVISQGIEVETAFSPAPFVDLTAGITYADTAYENDLIGNDTGAPLDPALRRLPGRDLSNAPDLVVTGSFAWTPPIGDSGMSGLLYVNTRLTGDYNTGSDLLPAKEQDGYVLVNARVGVRGPDERWAVEAWAQNLFDEKYTQVGFNTPFIAPQQTFSAYLAEPRTYGVTVRGRF